MKLTEIIKHLPKSVASGDLNREIVSVTCDSRAVREGSIFIALRGEEVDGHDFIGQAIEAGASAIVAQRAPDGNWSESTTWIHASDSRRALGVIADLVYARPSSQLKIAGVTGTNGKTTTTFLLHHILASLHRRAGLMGTIFTHDGLEAQEATHTTPRCDELHALLQTMVENECRGAAMEVSSHGISQQRIEGVEFDVAVFTNLTQDHLDYHGSMDAYYQAKKAFFDSLITQAGVKRPVAVINTDDAWGQKLVKDIGDSLPVVSYGAGVHCDFRLGKLVQTIKTCEFELLAKGKSFLVRLPIFGRFNVYNAIAAIASAVAMGVRLRDAVRAITETPQIPGRLEWVVSNEGMNVFVDYAHTPDALENVCATLKELDPKRLITVFGCGGDRDRAKRPLMGQAASRYSDLCFVTSDNPRSEPPGQICQHIEEGMGSCPYRVIENREEAITTAIHLATPGDIVLVAGKGHENYQEFADEVVEFDDCSMVKKAVGTRPLPPRVLRQREEAKHRRENQFVRRKEQAREDQQRSESRDSSYGQSHSENRERRDDDRRGGESRDRRDDRPARPPYRGDDRRGGESRDRRDDRPTRPPYRGDDRRGGEGRDRRDERPTKPPYRERDQRGENTSEKRRDK